MSTTTNERPPLLQLTWSFVIGFLLIETFFSAVLLGAAYLFFASNRTIEAAPEGREKDVKAMLNKQVDDWNKGDLDGFMAGYWKDNGLTFYSGGTIASGWQATMDRYKKRYKADGKEMGSLTFSDLQVSLFDDDRALARGRWKLTMKNGSTPNGLFTLILRRIGGHWRIVHDHTSAAEKTP